MTSFWSLILFLLLLSHQAIIDEFFKRLKSVICKKYTNTDEKDRKYTNTINMSII